MVINMISVVCGIILGGACVVVYFQSAKLLYKLLSAIMALSGGAISYNIIKVLTGATELHVLQLGFLLLIISFLITMLITFYIFCNIIKSEDKNGIIGIREILLGQHKYIQQVYEKKADRIFNTRLLENEQRELDADRQELGLREQAVRERERKLELQLKEGVVLQLPVDMPVPMTNELLREFPNYTEGLSKFMNDIQQVTDEYVEMEIPVDAQEKYNRLYSYFLFICSLVLKDIFDTTSSNVRIHFRYLKDNNYIKLVAKDGNKIYEDELTSIPMGKGLINRSFTNQTSLIKSLNQSDTFKAKNRNIWEDFMTIAFYSICKYDAPFISMGISVKNKERYKNLLYFLNFYKIENLLEENLKKINKRYNIVATIEGKSKKEGDGPNNESK